MADLNVGALLSDVARTCERRIPREERPPPEDEAAYLRGFAHGYSTAFLFAEEVTSAARMLALLTEATAVAAFLEQVARFAVRWRTHDPAVHAAFTDEDEE